MLSSLGDPSEAIRELSMRIVAAIISPRVRDLLHGYFTEVICFLCGFLTHPNIKIALDVHPLSLDVCSAAEVCIEAFRLRHNDDRRNKVYSQLLMLASDSSRHELMTKLLTEFLPPFLPASNLDGRECIPVPLSRDDPSGLALADVLRVLASSDLRVTFASFQPSADPAADQTIPEEELTAQREQRAHFNRAIMQQFLSKSVLPPLVALRRALRECNSALQKDVFDCIAQLLFEWRNEMDEMVDDAHLLQLLKKAYTSEETADADPDEQEKTFEEVFLRQNLRSKYSRKPLSTLSTTYRHSTIRASIPSSTMAFPQSSSILISSACPRSVIPVASVTVGGGSE